MSLLKLKGRAFIKLNINVGIFKSLPVFRAVQKWRHKDR